MKFITVLTESDYYTYLYLNGKLRAVTGPQPGDGDFQMRSHPEQLQLLPSSASPARFTSFTLCSRVLHSLAVASQANCLLHTLSRYILGRTV